MVINCLDTINIYKIMHEYDYLSDYYIFNSNDVKITFNNKKYLTSYAYLDVGILMNKEFIFKGNVVFGILKLKTYKEMLIKLRKKFLLDSLK